MLHYRSNKSLSVKFHRDLANKPGRHESSRKGFWTRRFVEFCKRTDLHGYKYIVMEDLNNVERTCWAVAVFVSVVIAIYFVFAAYNWYARNSIITVIESNQGAIWDIPFPAVTICDLNAISRKAARSFANNVTLPHNVTSDFIFDTIRFAPLLHSTYITTAEQKNKLQVLQQVLDLNKVSIETLFRILSPAASCGDLVQRCMWKNTMYRCDQLFQQVFTIYKLCCAFNYYAVKPPNANHLNSEEQMFQLPSPRRVASCGYQTALTVLLNTNRDDYYSTLVASQGALVFIDSAYNVPNQESPVRMVNPSTEVLIALSPERTYTTSGIKSFNPDQRQCFYNNEIKLGEYRQYSLHNCIEYQRMEIIRKVCECVPFYVKVTDFPRICNFHDVECLEMALRELGTPALTSHLVLRAAARSPRDVIGWCEGWDAVGRVVEFSSEFSSSLMMKSWLAWGTSQQKELYLTDSRPTSEESLSKLDKAQTFNCLPECEHYDYPIEVAMGKLAGSVKLSGLPFFNNVDMVNRSVLNVFFNDLVSTRFRRDVYFNWQNFLAAFGGLLSLMLGFTLISGFDFVLFFTLRLVYEPLPEAPKDQNTSKTNLYTDYDKKVNNWMDKSIRDHKLMMKGLEIRHHKKTFPSRY